MIQIEINKESKWHKKVIDIDFNKMIAYVNKSSFDLYRDDKNIWLFSKKNRRQKEDN